LASTAEVLRAPFPWFGGKSRVAGLVWQRFGDVRNYVEPFAGSLAVLLGRPSAPRIETVNDIDCYLANFWRAIAADPDGVARFADQPVNEADLHARHRWLVSTGKERIERLRTDPEYFDVQVAGWWVWGLCLWIGSGWCAHVGAEPAGDVPLIWEGRGNGAREPRGIHSISVSEKRPHTSTARGNGVGVASANHAKRGGAGVHAQRLAQQLPQLSGDGSGAQRGLLRHGVIESTEGLYGYLATLADRLRRVRVCCGDWKRVLGPSVTTCIGTTGVFLDPPYHGVGAKERTAVYGHENEDIFAEVAAWAIANGDNPKLRIAVCGYEGLLAFPEGWSEVSWKASGGYSRSEQGKKNRNRERIWFSPHCQGVQQPMLELGA
jgi:DNA adenine methylase